MGANSKIEWTDHTWNPWYGCHKVSQGCKNCYMFRQQARYGRDGNVVQRSRTTFGAPLVWAKKSRRRSGERMKVFTCSWSDFFIEEAGPWRAEAWDIIRQTPELTYLILTKRPERIVASLPDDWGQGWEHVWLGVSVEDQASADVRIPLLIQVPARKRFISAEPLLGQVDLIQSAFIPSPEGCSFPLPFVRAIILAGIDWVIAGGESGPLARPCNPAWVRTLRDQCITISVPFFFKQWGEWLPSEAHGLKTEYLGVGRKLAGHTLDGREWQQCPEW